MPGSVINAASAIVFANHAAEYFFATSAAVLRRSQLTDVVAFSSPLFGLLDQVREAQATIAEYAVHIGTPRTGGERLVDVQAAPVADEPGTVLLMVVARAAAERSTGNSPIANAARAVSGLASVLRTRSRTRCRASAARRSFWRPRCPARIASSPASSVPRPTASAISSNQMEVFSDDRAPPLEPVNLHTVLNHAKAVAQAGFARGITIREDYDPSLPAAHANRDQLVQVFINLLKNAAKPFAAVRFPVKSFSNRRSAPACAWWCRDRRSGSRCR